MLWWFCGKSFVDHKVVHTQNPHSHSYMHLMVVCRTFSAIDDNSIVYYYNKTGEKEWKMWFSWLPTLYEKDEIKTAWEMQAHTGPRVKRFFFLPNSSSFVWSVRYYFFMWWWWYVFFFSWFDQASTKNIAIQYMPPSVNQRHDTNTNTLNVRIMKCLVDEIPDFREFKPLRVSYV